MFCSFNALGVVDRNVFHTAKLSFLAVKALFQNRMSTWTLEKNPGKRRDQVRMGSWYQEDSSSKPGRLLRGAWIKYAVQKETFSRYARSTVFQEAVRKGVKRDQD